MSAASTCCVLIFHSLDYDLSNTDEVLLRAAIVKTFSQIPGVAKVMITVGSEQLRDAEGQPVPAMDASSFIDTKEGGINSYLYAKLSLYFPDASGKKLEQETRALHYSSNMVLERVIIEQLIAGSEEKGRQAIFSDEVKIQNMYIKNGVCTVSFDAEAQQDADGQYGDAGGGIVCRCKFYLCDLRRYHRRAV